MQFITLNCSCPDHICSVFDKVISLQSSIMQQSQLRMSYKQRSYSAVKAIFSYIKAEWDGTSSAEPSAVPGSRWLCMCAPRVTRGQRMRAGPAAHAHTCAHTCGAIAPHLPRLVAETAKRLFKPWFWSARGDITEFCPFC